MNTKKLLLVPAALACVFSVAGCKKKVQVEPNTIQIKMSLGGYGYAWMEQLIQKFEETYAAEGYKVKLFQPTYANTGSFVNNDLISGFNKRGIDLYFTGSLKPETVYNKGDVLVEELSDLVYDQKALKFDGTEEEKTVREKLDPAFGKEWYQYNDQSYTYFYQKSIGALVVNREKLRACGYDYLPKTTNQFFDMIHNIRQNQRRIRPLVAVDSTGYASVMINSWYTQLAGVDKWDGFWSMNNPDGTQRREDGYEVFNDEELITAGGMVFKTYDFENFVDGSKNYSISTAHDSLMLEDRGGVFLFDGDWALQETATDHPSDEELSKLAFINVPVISELGIKLWGGTYVAEACEDILLKVIDDADAGKSYAEAVADVASLGYTVSEESVKAVYRARGIYNNRGVETGTAYVTKGIPDTHRDIVSKFLRMMASDDFSQMYFKTARCFSPYSTSISEDTNLLDFSLGHAAIATHKDAYPIWPMTTGLRRELGGKLAKMFPEENAYFHSVALDCSFTAFNSDTGAWEPEKYSNYREYAKEEILQNYRACKNDWSTYLRVLGD